MTGTERDKRITELEADILAQRKIIRAAVDVCNNVAIPKEFGTDEYLVVHRRLIERLAVLIGCTLILPPRPRRIELPGFRALMAESLASNMYPPRSSDDGHVHRWYLTYSGDPTYNRWLCVVCREKRSVSKQAVPTAPVEFESDGQ